MRRHTRKNGAASNSQLITLEDLVQDVGQIGSLYVKDYGWTEIGNITVSYDVSRKRLSVSVSLADIQVAYDSDAPNQYSRPAPIEFSIDSSPFVALCMTDDVFLCLRPGDPNG